MKKLTEQARQAMILRLERDFDLGGGAALEGMRFGEIRLLESEKMLKLSLVAEKLHLYPHSEIHQLLKGRLDHDLAVIHGWMEEQAKDRGHER